MTKKTFEEEFPSFKDDDFTCDAPSYENCPDCKNVSNGNCCIYKDAVEKHCLDKQRVKEAYLLLKVSLGGSFFDVTQSPYARVMLEFEEELSLDR